MKHRNGPIVSKVNDIARVDPDGLRRDLEERRFLTLQTQMLAIYGDYAMNEEETIMDIYWEDEMEVDNPHEIAMAIVLYQPTPAILHPASPMEIVPTSPVLETSPATEMQVVLYSPRPTIPIAIASPVHVSTPTPTLDFAAILATPIIPCVAKRSYSVAFGPQPSSHLPAKRMRMLEVDDEVVEPSSVDDSTSIPAAQPASESALEVVPYTRLTTPEVSTIISSEPVASPRPRRVPILPPAVISVVTFTGEIHNFYDKGKKREAIVTNEDMLNPLGARPVMNDIKSLDYQKFKTHFFDARLGSTAGTNSDELDLSVSERSKAFFRGKTTYEYVARKWTRPIALGQASSSKPKKISQVAGNRVVNEVGQWRDLTVSRWRKSSTTKKQIKPMKVCQTHKKAKKATASHTIGIADLVLALEELALAPAPAVLVQDVPIIVVTYPEDELAATVVPNALTVEEPSIITASEVHDDPFAIQADAPKVVDTTIYKPKQLDEVFESINSESTSTPATPTPVSRELDDVQEESGSSALVEPFPAQPLPLVPFTPIRAGMPILPPLRPASSYNFTPTPKKHIYQNLFSSISTTSIGELDYIDSDEPVAETRVESDSEEDGPGAADAQEEHVDDPAEEEEVVDVVSTREEPSANDDRSSWVPASLKGIFGRFGR